ncbi:MAG: carbohydrate kinase family protein, partial [Chitinophagaceae bacterium]|nr:carbohydrate kinase family protein [Chitinophagaceae bacterium]
LYSAAHLHISSVFLQPGLKPGLVSLFSRARNLGLTTSFDPQWDPAEEWDCDLENLLPQVNIFLPNIEELKNITGKNSLEECLSGLKNRMDMIVVKKGNEGAVLWLDGKMITQPAFLNKKVVDAIGAGDSFNAGFIHQFVNKNSVDLCLEFGALCGAVNTTESGGTTAFRNHDTFRQIALEKFNYQL